MENQKLELKNLVDLDFLQKFQDAFAKVMNIACISYDMEHAVTRPSNFSEFCYKYTRKSPIGLAMCEDCFLKWGELAAKEGKPVIYQCDTGLTNMAVPIIVDNTQIGTIHAGQIFTEEIDENKLRTLAKAYGIKNEDEYIESAKKITIIPKKNLQAVADLLFLVANAFSKIGNQNSKLILQTKRELLYRTVVEALRNSLDIELTKRKIVDIIGEALNADRCFIVEYDSISDKFLVVSNEYLSSQEVESYKGMNVNTELPQFLQIVKDGIPIIISEGEVQEKKPNKDYSKEESAIKRYNIHSAYAVPFKYYDKLLGVLSLHFSNPEHKSTEEELELVQMLSSQVAIAIYQAKLFNTIKSQAERERMSKSISEILRSSLNKDIIKHLFVQNIGKYFKADRVFFAEYDFDKKIYLPVDEKSEYLSDKYQKSYINYEWIGDEVKDYITPLLGKREIIVPDLDEYLSKFEKSNEFIKLFRESDVKSSYNFPVLYEERIMGYFCIEYTKDVNIFSEEDIMSIRSVCSQAGIALYHSMLYKKAHDEAVFECHIIKELYTEIKTTLQDMMEFSDEILKDGEDPLLKKEYLKQLREKESELMKLLMRISEEDSREIL